MARAIHLMTDVIGPKEVKEIHEVEAAITAWETRVRKLGSEFGEKLSSTMKNAIVTGMMPVQIQDYVYTSVDEKSEYTTVAARIKTWAENKAAMMNGPVPMDVGEVQWDESADEWEEVDVQAVGPDVRCHRCSGWGHMARECATPMSKGKAGKGADFKGKGKSKGGDASFKGGKLGPRITGKGGKVGSIAFDPTFVRYPGATERGKGTRGKGGSAIGKSPAPFGFKGRSSG